MGLHSPQGELFLSIRSPLRFASDDFLKLSNATARYAHPPALAAFLLAALGFGGFGGVFLHHVAMIPERA